MLDPGTRGLIGSVLNFKRGIDTVDYLYLYAILHVPAVDHLCVYIKLLIVPSHTLRTQ